MTLMERGRQEERNEVYFKERLLRDQRRSAYLQNLPREWRSRLGGWRVQGGRNSVPCSAVTITTEGIHRKKEQISFQTELSI